MKRSHKTPIIVAVLLLAASAIPTSVFAENYDAEQRVFYYQYGMPVGGAVYSACVGSNWSWGQQGGHLKLEKGVKCSDGSAVYCRWFSWTGSDWELMSYSNCNEGAPPADDEDREMAVPGPGALQPFAEAHNLDGIRHANDLASSERRGGCRP